MNNGFDWDSFITRVELLDHQGKAVLLAKAAYELTMRARDTYEPGTRGVSEPARLRGINEAMHRLTRRIPTLNRGTEGDWKEAEFWQALQEISQGGSCAEDLVSAATNSIK
jgi:hypothetical protein